MKTRFITVPYDSGRRDWRLGAGPQHWVASGIVDELASRGHAVTRADIALPGGDRAEIAGAFEIARDVAGEVRTALHSHELPIVLAGNCASSWGTVAALREFEPAVIWFDAHGDLNTPETTSSGFLDGMSLAVLTGRCWQGMTETIEGFSAVNDRNVVLIGVRDLDPAERELVDRGAITRARLMESLREKLEDLRLRCRVAYVHLDLDVIDAAVGRANQFAAYDGLSGVDLIDALRLIQQYVPIAGINITAYDPAIDTDRAIERIGCDLLRALPEILNEPQIEAQPM